MDNALDMIREAEREIQRDAEDLSRLKLRYPGWDFVQVSTAQPPVVITRSPRVELSSLERDVLSVVNSKGMTNWTTRTVVTEMRSLSLRLPENDEAAMNSVGYALISLMDNGHIQRVHQGRGRDPHRYQPLEVKEETPA